MSTRQDLYAQVQEFGNYWFIEEKTGKNYTNCSNDELRKVLDDYIKQFTGDYEKECTIEDVLSQEDTEESKQIHLTVSDEKFNDVIKMAEDAIFQAKAAIITLEGFLNIVKSWETD